MAAATSTSAYWLRVSSVLVALMGVYMLVNTVRAFGDPVGFAAYMGLPLSDPANHAFVQVYALRALFLGLCVLALLFRRDTRALAVFALVAVVMPVGDAMLTAANGAPIAIVARHGATAIVLAVTASLLFSRAAKEN
jgi:heme A synthase